MPKEDSLNPPIGWPQVILPFIAGVAHLHVVFHSAFHNLLPITRGDTANITTEMFMDEAYLLDRAVFIAYVIDLACCYFKAVPFSRCNSPKDIIEHHLPTLLLALPLAVPIWSDIRSLEPSLVILDLKVGDPFRAKAIKGFMMASGFAYISSMNEVFMCFQRVEMSWQGVTAFRDIPKMKNHFFTSRLVVGTELCYKLAFFWGLSIFACKGCVDLPMALYSFHTAIDKPVWRSLMSVFFSPVVLRGALFLAFSVVMYPSMGARCLRKIKQHFREDQRKKEV